MLSGEKLDMWFNGDRVSSPNALRISLLSHSQNFSEYQRMLDSTYFEAMSYIIGYIAKAPEENGTD